MLNFWPHYLTIIQVWTYKKVSFFECICIHLVRPHIDCIKGLDAFVMAQCLCRFIAHVMQCPIVMEFWPKVLVVMCLIGSKFPNTFHLFIVILVVNQGFVSFPCHMFKLESSMIMWITIVLHHIPPFKLNS
jgi:hypothetical protein